MLLVLLAATPSPAPSLAVSPNSVTPGIVGFFAILLVAVGAVLLGVDMVRRVRRVRYRGELAERRDRAEREGRPGR